MKKNRLNRFNCAAAGKACSKGIAALRRLATAQAETSAGEEILQGSAIGMLACATLTASYVSGSGAPLIILFGALFGMLVGAAIGLGLWLASAALPEERVLPPRRESRRGKEEQERERQERDGEK